MKFYQAYKGYLITKNPIRPDEFYVTKDGHLICTKKSEEAAKADIDGLVD